MTGFTRREVLSLSAMAMATTAVRLQGWTQFVPDVEIELTARPGQAQILPGRATDVWQFTGRVIKGPASTLQPVAGSYLGPTIRLQRGQQVRITFANRLPDPSIVHWHGLDVPESADGHPRLAVDGGKDYVYDFEVTNRAGTYWYHPHPHMQTGPQVYSGLAGLLIVSDEEEAALSLPSGSTELLAVIQDRRFDAANQLVYSTSMMDMETGFLGNRVLVNGQPAPTWSLATRAYRIRVLNGSNARVYKLAWSDGTPMTVLGTDGGLLERPHTQRFVTLAPAQRVDLWLDLSQRTVNTKIQLQSAAFALTDAGLNMGGMMGGGRMGGMGGGRGNAMASDTLALGAPVSLLTLSVDRREKGAASLPTRLSTFDRSWLPVTDAPVRQIPITFRMMEWFFAGRTFTDMTEVAADETVRAGSTQIWEFVNAGGPMGMQMAHPIHIHGRQFRVVSRTGGKPDNTLREGLVDGGWTDTALVLPNETVRLQVPFTSHPGLYLYHCHILEHEDMGMMRNFKVV
jgi:FtsP/CotA-like multicopper oxidase with cupredoxin domain